MYIARTLAAGGEGLTSAPSGKYYYFASFPSLSLYMTEVHEGGDIQFFLSQSGYSASGVPVVSVPT